MTEQEEAYYRRLVAQYDSLVAENSRLRDEISYGEQQCSMLEREISRVASDATGQVSGVGTRIGAVEDCVRELNLVLADITEHYFLFKNLSEASKKLTQYSSEYQQRFHFYHELRRISLGFVIGVDAHIVSSETLRKKVETAYLANTDYWLAYAISAVMLWASDAREAAYRALNKAMTMDCYRSSVFFMLVNLRFTRVDAARNWYISLLDKTDVNNMSPEWQHVLHAYLVGAMRADAAFTQMASGYFARMLEQTEATSADYSGTVIQAAQDCAANQIHVTDQEYPLLHETSSAYADMRMLLSDLEKIRLMTVHYDEVYQMEAEAADTIYEQIENILYDLVSGYDDEEFKVVREIRRNEAIIAAKGDMALAEERFQAQIGSIGGKASFGDLMIRWAFSEDYSQTDITVKRFALSYLKDRIAKGFRNYFESRMQTEKELYPVSIHICAEIGDYNTECDENAFQSQSEKLTAFCGQHKLRYIMADKYLKIFIILCFAAVGLLGIAALTLHSRAFPVLLTLGLVLGIVSGFLVWRRWVDKAGELKEHIRLALVKLRSTLDEMADWRRRLHAEYAALDDLSRAVDRF